jgi:Domain of unknown function (DUF4383)
MTVSTRATGARTGLQKAALATGALFLLVGALGFIPGITSNYEALGMAGHGSGALLLGVFQVSILHNIVHLIFGVVGLLMARTGAAAVTYLAVGGVVYLVLTVYGFVVGHGSDANFVPVNNADNWLHLGLGLGMLLLAMVARQRMTDGATRAR